MITPERFAWDDREEEPACDPATENQRAQEENRRNALEGWRQWYAAKRKGEQ